MENNNNTQEFDMEKYNDFLKTIKAGSPVHKVNFTMEDANAIVGMFLITKPDVKSYIDKAADYTNLEKNTLLVFESRHVVECCQIIYGCLNIFTSVGMYKMNYEYFINRIIKVLLTKPIFYSTLITEMDNITDSCITLHDSEQGREIYGGFKYLMRNIWFIPYGKIDEMANEAIEEFKNQSGEGEDNE